jgi:hypothetical protein
VAELLLGEDGEDVGLVLARIDRPAQHVFVESCIVASADGVEAER